MFRRFILPLLLVSCFLAACGDPPLEELPPEQIIARSAERMNDMEGFYFAIDRTGAQAFLDSAETISFRQAEGYYAAPDRAQAAVRVIAPGLVTEVNVISIGETQFRVRLVGSSVIDADAGDDMDVETTVALTAEQHTTDLIDIHAAENSQRWRIADQLEKVGKKR